MLISSPAWASTVLGTWGEPSRRGSQSATLSHFPSCSHSQSTTLGRRGQHRSSEGLGPCSIIQAPLPFCPDLTVSPLSLEPLLPSREAGTGAELKAEWRENNGQRIPWQEAAWCCGKHWPVSYSHISACCSAKFSGINTHFSAKGAASTSCLET